MAKWTKFATIIRESIFIFADLVLIFLLVFLLRFSADHALFFFQSFADLAPEQQQIKEIRNSMLFMVAVVVTIVTVFIQWIVGRLRDINRAFKTIRMEVKHGGRKYRKKSKNRRRNSHAASIRNRRYNSSTLAGRSHGDIL